MSTDPYYDPRAAHRKDPQPRRAFIEPANGVDQWQQPQAAQPFQHPYPPAQLPQHDLRPIVINNVAHAQAAAAVRFDGRPRTNHVLHLIATICTGGLWGIAWLILWLSRGCR